MHKMICLLVVLATNAAQAAIIVDDQVGVLSPAARQDLAATSTPHRVVASFVKVASEADLDALVGKCVTTPNTRSPREDRRDSKAVGRPVGISSPDRGSPGGPAAAPSEGGPQVCRGDGLDDHQFPGKGPAETFPPPRERTE